MTLILETCDGVLHAEVITPLPLPTCWTGPVSITRRRTTTVDTSLLRGYYCLPYINGLAAAHLMHCINRFATTFTKTVVDGVQDELLTCPGVEPSLPALLI